MTSPAVPGRPRTSRFLRWAGDALGVALSIVFAGMSLFGRWGDHDSAAVVAQHPWVLALPLPAIVALLVRRRWPLAALAVTLAVLVAGTLIIGDAMAFIVPVVITSFRVTSTVRRGWALTATLITVAVLIAVEACVDGLNGFDFRLLQPVAFVIAAAAAGDATRSRRAFIQAMTERAERAEQTREAEAQRRVAEERLRIARDLHDAVAHQITVINLHSGVAAGAVAEGREPQLDVVRQSLDIVGSASQTVLGEISELLLMLRGDGESAELAPQPGLAQLDTLAESFTRDGMPVTIRREGSRIDLPPSVDRVAYQVIREGLTNAHKHGGAGHTHVLLTRETDAFQLSITNIFVSDAPASPSTGLGLIGVRERVSAVRGTMDAGRVGGTFRLAARFPLGASDGAPR